MHRTIIALAFIVSLCVALHVATAKVGQEEAKPKKPDATVDLKGGSVAAGVGISWESGTLTYKGRTYPISVTGLDIGDVGAAKVTASGKVYDLKRLDDFDGNYAAVGAEATIGGGVSVITMENQKRVRVNLVSTTQGVKLALATGGVGMTIKK
jgi:hypothetical protein